MLLFTFEQKYTGIYNKSDVRPFHVQCFPCYNGMSSLRVAQGDGLRIRNVAGTVSIDELRTADKRWPFNNWLEKGEN